MLVHTLIVIWYARSGHDPADIDDRRAAQPWYRTKTEPAFEDMLIKLRRTLIVARFPQAAHLSPLTSKSTPCSRPGTPPQHKYETSDTSSVRKSRCRVRR